MTKVKFNRRNFIKENDCILFTAKEVSNLIGEYKGDALKEREILLNEFADWGRRTSAVTGIIYSTDFNHFIETQRGKT